MRFILLAFAALMIAVLPSTARANCPQELVGKLDDMRRRLPQLQDWLAETGLGAQLEILRTRCAPHPRSFSSYGLRLELRWLSNSVTRDAALKAFAAFDDDFTMTNGQTLRHRLFIKALHWSAAPSQALSVHMYVIDTDLAVFLDVDGRIQTKDGLLRMVVRRSEFVPQAHGVAPRLARPASLPYSTLVLPDGGWLAKALEQHFGNRGRFRSLETNQTFFSFAVDKLRGEVTEGEHWEQLEGTLQILPGTSGHQLMLHLDGRFAAAGLGDRPPDPNAFRDMEPQFNEQLDRYAQTLLESVKLRLEENTK